MPRNDKNQRCLMTEEVILIHVTQVYRAVIFVQVLEAGDERLRIFHYNWPS